MGRREHVAFRHWLTHYYLAPCTALALLIPSSFYIIGSLYPPETLLLLLPRAAPPPPARDSEEGRLQTEQLEQELQALDVVRRERERVAASNGEMYEYRELACASTMGVSPADRGSTGPFLEPMHPHSLTSSILRGPNMLALPPIVFADHDETEATVIVHLGRSLCGHDGIVHGGLLATMFDETMARNVIYCVLPAVSVSLADVLSPGPDEHSIQDWRHGHPRCRLPQTCQGGQLCRHSHQA